MNRKNEFENHRSEEDFLDLQNMEDTAALSEDSEVSPGKTAFEWIQALLFAVLIVILFFVFGVRMIGVDGTSMLQTLQNNDKILVLSALWCTPENGDIVVLRKESFMESPIVKRIIATQGQTVDINFETGEVSVDNVVLDEPYINEKTYSAGDMVFPYTVDEGCVFVMGDNRNGSTDSRWSWLGEVDRRYIMGEAFAVILPGRSEDTGKIDFSRIGFIN